MLLVTGLAPALPARFRLGRRRLVVRVRGRGRFRGIGGRCLALEPSKLGFEFADAGGQMPNQLLY